MRKRAKEIVVNPPSKPRGVILSAHGFLMTPAQLQHSSGLDAVGAATHSIVHYLSAGPANTWQWWPGRSIADFNYITGWTLYYREAGLPVSLAGHSAGACMMARMAAERPEFFQSVGLYAGWLHEDIAMADGDGLPVLVLRGRSDRLVRVGQTKETAARFAAAGYEVIERHNMKGGHVWQFDNNAEFIAVIQRGRKRRAA